MRSMHLFAGAGGGLLSDASVVAVNAWENAAAEEVAERNRRIAEVARLSQLERDNHDLLMALNGGMMIEDTEDGWVMHRVVVKKTRHRRM